MTESLQSMSARADACKTQGDYASALAIYQAAVKAWPGSIAAMHNLAATLGDMAQHAACANAARKAIQLGSKAPETRLVLARALMLSGQLAPAEAAYRAAIQLRPDLTPALFELAQLLWMSGGDSELALRPLAAAVKANPRSGPLHQALAQALAFTGDKPAAARVLLDLAERGGADATLLAQAADLLIEIGDLASGLALAQQASQADRSAFVALMTLTRAYLATGQVENASKTVAQARSRNPLDQHALALQANVWRVSGDPRFQELYDYNDFVRSYLIDAPAGWESRANYLQDLAAELKSAHVFQTHPFGHSVRQGSQLPNLFTLQSPAIQALRSVLKAPIDAYLQHLGTAGGPLRSRNTGTWQIQGIWSVWLRPGGYHVDHVHQEGWLSSAFYVELPEVLNANSKEGWIRFGESGSPTQPPQLAQHFVQPEPGMLVLFPSYMWHGTVPFGGDQSRLTVALDIIPAPALPQDNVKQVL